MITMKLKNINIRYFIAILLMALMILGGCSDEPVVSPDFTISGEATTVKLKLSVPEMTKMTRANLPEADMYRINNVWIRTYSSNTKEATSEWLKVDGADFTAHDPLQEVSLDTKSGYSYIVAIANVNNSGRIIQENGEVGESKPLSDLLVEADTWDKFLSIVVETPNEYAPNLTNGLVMSGCYAPSTEHGQIIWREQNFEPVFIPATSTGGEHSLDGVIHLRRAVAHVRFNLIPGEDVTLIPRSYRVFNKPRYAYVYERNNGGESGMNAYPNVGDRSTSQTASNYYETGVLHSDQYINKGENNGSYTFDFWQLENKHTGLESCKTYDDREKELKNNNGESIANSGLYTSLCGNNVWTPANMATYVEISCIVERKNANPFDDALSDDDVSASYGNAVFTIHLGFCEEKNGTIVTEATCRDFNCRRNTEYTYNVTINDVNNIYLEASSDPENEQQPGMEGIVYDIINPRQTLDAHYATFNIEITPAEARSNEFGYAIEAYDENGTLVTFDEKKNTTADIQQNLYANWIELRPTTREDVLATYYPRNGGNADEASKTFLLSDLKTVASDESHSAHSNSNWYTVFVNEYVYETATDGNESGSTAWKKYVNKPDRRFWIKIDYKISPDGESIYARSKYAISQRSIQSYYSVAENGSPTAIGVEHTNENRGLTLRQSVHGSDLTNGRYNVWQAWLNGENKGTVAGKSWKDVVDFKTPQEIPQYNFPTDPKTSTSIAEHTENLPATIPYIGTATKTDYDPSDQIIEAINACMNRNRDNNGDGNIDASELRWYVPAAGKYLRCILGRNSLATPLMDYDNTPQLAYTDNRYNSYLLLYTSDGNVLWTMEGVSLSEVIHNRSEAPWNVRCIRNLGTNMSEASEGEKVTRAYQHDETNRIVRMSYYDELSIRLEKFDEPLPPHYIYDVNPTKNYNKVYKAFEYSQGGNSVTNGNVTSRYDVLYNALTLTQWRERVAGGAATNPCSNLNTGGETGWRVPNQKELTIMRNLGLFDGMNVDISLVLSCTQEFYESGKGITIPGTDDANRAFMATRKDGGTRFVNGWNPPNIYVRCVRDVEP